VYLQPNDWRNQRAVGYDMYSQPTRRAAMQQAVLTGEPVLSGPVRLLQETNLQPQVGALLYQAVYRQPEAVFPSSEDRLRRLRGWAYSPLRIGDLIQGALATVQAPALENAAVVIYDSDRTIKRNLVFDNRNLAGSGRLTHPTWRNLTVAGRNWQIGVQLDNRSIDPDGWSQGLLLEALLGISLSALAAVISQRLLDSHLELREALAREQDAAKERALAATVFDTSPIGIVVTDPNGIIVRVNPAFTQLSGYSDREARGQKSNLMRSGRHEASFYKQMWSRSFNAVTGTAKSGIAIAMVRSCAMN
jgi:PAS domain S-box